MVLVECFRAACARKQMTLLAVKPCWFRRRICVIFALEMIGVNGTIRCVKFCWVTEWVLLNLELSLLVVVPEGKG